jgi:excisionase family DNA binding protein
MDASMPSVKGYKIQDAANSIGVSRMFLEKEIKRGRLRLMRFSRRCVRVPVEDWNAYLAKHMTK